MLKSRAIKSLSVLLCLIIALSAFVTASAQTVTAETPRSADETQLLWSQRIGTNYKNAPSVPTVSAPFIMNFMLPVPLASLDAVEICSEISVAGISSCALDTS